MGNNTSIPNRELTPDEKKALQVVQKEIVKGVVIAK